MSDAYDPIFEEPANDAALLHEIARQYAQRGTLVGVGFPTDHDISVAAINRDRARRLSEIAVRLAPVCPATRRPIPDFYALYPKAVEAIKRELERLEDGETTYGHAFAAIAEILDDVENPT